MKNLEARLVEILREDADLMHVLTTVRGLDLPDWRVFSGAIYQSAWSGQRVQLPLKADPKRPG